MHRSGTSFLARALNLGGLYLGDLESLISHEWLPAEDNLKGHWENRKFLELGEKILTNSGGSWEDPPEKIIITEELGRDLAFQIKELSSHPSLGVGFKDPRIVLFYDLLKKYLPKNFVIIGIFRHPLKVAESLKKRNGFSYEKSLNLWKIYNKKLLDILNESDGFLIDFDWSKDKLFSEMNYVMQRLGLFNINISHWFSDELLHSDKEYDPHYSVPAEIDDIYHSLIEKSRSNNQSKISYKQDSHETLPVIQGLLETLRKQGEYFKKINDENMKLVKDIKAQQDPLSNLLNVYYRRTDLKKLFPEVSQGNYYGLLEWAKKVSTTAEDSEKSAISKYSKWYTGQDSFISKEKLSEIESLQKKQNLEVTSIRNDLTSATAQISSLKDDLTKKDADLTSATAQISSLKDEIIKKYNDLTSATAKISSLKDELVRKEADLTKKDADLTSASAQIFFLKDEIVKRDQEILLRKQPDYVFRKTCGKILDKLLPTDSKYDKHKKVLVASYNTIKTEGMGNYLKHVNNKIKKGEFLLANDISNKPVDKIKNEFGLDLADLDDFHGYDKIDNYDEFLGRIKLDNAILKAQTKLANTFDYKPLVSIIIPVYNPNLEFFKEAIDSVLRQSYDNFELCMCNDGSNNEDEIKKIIEGYRDKRIKYTSLPKNMGIVAAQNKAYEISKGDYIGFMDQDDLLFPNALFDVVKHLNGYRADILYSDEVKFDPTKRLLEIASKRDYSFRPLWLANFMSHLTIINRKILESSKGLFEPGYDFSQDFELLLRTSEKTDKIVHIRRFLYAWRIHPGSTASSANSAQKPAIYPAAKKAIIRTLQSQKIDGVVSGGEHLGQFVVKINKIPNDPRKTINFILPGIGQGGGARVVFQVANKLRMWGFDANIIFPRIPYSFSEKDVKINNLSNDENIEHLCVTNENNFDIRANLIRVPYICDKFIPDALATVATAWPTAYSVNALDDKKGKKFYFVQHYETWQGPKETVDNTYRLGLGNIVVADWLKEVIGGLGGKTVGKVTVPVDSSLFFRYPDRKRKGNELKILLQYRPEHSWKGSMDGIEAFKMVKQKCPDIKLVTYGIAGSVMDFIRGTRTNNSLAGSDIRDLYNSCDIMIFPSWTEGCSLPPMEAMACGTTLCTTNCTGTSEYGKNEYNCMISPIKNPKAMADNLERVINNKDLRENLAENGYNSVQHRTPEKFTEDFLRLMNIKYKNTN